MFVLLHNSRKIHTDTHTLESNDPLFMKINHGVWAVGKPIRKGKMKNETDHK